MPAMNHAEPTRFQMLETGDAAFNRMLQAIHGARHSVLLETYTFQESAIGVRFRDALVRAARNKLEVLVVLDYIGSRKLRSSFWIPLIQAGGQFRWFNASNPWLIGIRNHRKILACDETTAFIGGFNIASEYEGDGIERGWRDLGLCIQGCLAVHLAQCVRDSFARAPFRPRPLQRLRRNESNAMLSRERWSLLLSGPGRGKPHLKRSIVEAIRKARSIRIMAAYFLPTWSILHALLRAARQGARAQLILAGRSDIPLSLMATRCLYKGLLKAGVEIYEYRPQILHAKLLIIDDELFVGSANLDHRSLRINYELLVRIRDTVLCAEARRIFEGDLKRCRRVHAAAWRKTRPVWQRWVERWAYWIFARVDPYWARLRAQDIP